ncbi:hypothetical protein F5883DRAFT_554449 [Diaporthe sp. PMI_573]|nr:hypothetical protein F5883DRAFT_554449 [Diaporthaceae sp. PMI_573]
MDAAVLSKEYMVYDHIRGIQGRFVPVCLGGIDLELPWYYDSGVFERFLFLSYAGQPIREYEKQDMAGVMGDLMTGLCKLHKCGVLHRDAELRNALHDARTGKSVIVDFERAELRPRQPLKPVSSNVRSRKRKRVQWGKGKDAYARELQSTYRDPFFSC